MSITFEIQGRTSSAWTLTSTCLEQIDRLRNTDARHLIDTVFGNDGTQAGTARTIDRAVLLHATGELLPFAKELPGGFEVHIPPFGGLLGGTGPGAGGVLVDGQYYYIRCWEDYWMMQSPDEMSGKKAPVRRYEPAEIQSENQGLIKVQVKKSRRSDLAKMLREVERFLKCDSSDNVMVIWG